MKFSKLRLLCAAAYISAVTTGAFADGIEGEEGYYNPNDVIIFDEYGSDSIIGDYPKMYPDDEDKNRLIGDYPEIFTADDNKEQLFSNEPELFSIEDDANVIDDNNIGLYPDDDMRKFFTNEFNLRQFLGLGKDMADYFTDNESVREFFEYNGGSKNNDGNASVFADPARVGDDSDNRNYYAVDDDSIMFLEEPTTGEQTVTDDETGTDTETEVLVTDTETEVLVTDTETEVLVTETETEIIVTETETEVIATETEVIATETEVTETNETLVTDLTDETLEQGEVTVEDLEGNQTGEEGTVPQTGVPFDFILAGFGTLIGISAFAASKKRPL